MNIADAHLRHPTCHPLSFELHLSLTPRPRAQFFLSFFLSLKMRTKHLSAQILYDGPQPREAPRKQKLLYIIYQDVQCTLCVQRERQRGLQGATRTV